MSDITSQQELEAALVDGWKFTPATLAQKITRGRWIPAKHLLYISVKIANALTAGGARIIVTMPPRHGKSDFLSVNTSIWHLEKWPDKYVMGISYGLELATDFSIKVRDTFLDEDNHHLLTTRLNRGKLKVDRFLTTGRGGYTAAGLGGTITGRGADYLFIDDYIKNAETALSKNQREKDWEWFKSTAFTRLEPNASIVILATRWDQDDLIGRCLTEMPEENWYLINLPAIAMVNDPLGRAEGEALWPERYSLEVLLKIKAALGNYWWMGMYQQDPLASMSGANLGDNLKIVPESDIPHYTTVKTIRVWDLASTEGGGDYTCGLKMALHKGSGRVYILDNQRFQKSPLNTEKMVTACAEGDGLGTKIWMEQEPGSSGVIVIAHYDKDVVGAWNFEGEKATGPIEVRAQPFLAGIEAGNVYAVEADWNDDLKTELNAFPDGDNDDQITAGALGYHKLVRNRYSSVVWGSRSPGQKRRAEQKIITPTSAEVTDITQARNKRLTW